ncbi:MAG: hypothetical protein PHY08_12810 [Candidatus Cloacimonetes bacterium]|nr:hypothetical protein [Candidatus Cloacimonadota bacterium]
MKNIKGNKIVKLPVGLSMSHRRVMKKIKELIIKGKEEDALLYLYETLTTNLNNVSECDLFLKHCIEKNITDDVIVKLSMLHHRVIHTLNALRPIREKLTDWTDFLDYAKNKKIVDKILNYYIK